MDQDYRSVSRTALSCTRVGTITANGPLVGRGVRVSGSIRELGLLGTSCSGRECKLRSGFVVGCPGLVGATARGLTGMERSMGTESGRLVSGPRFSVAVNGTACARHISKKAVVLRTVDGYGAKRAAMVNGFRKFRLLIRGGFLNVGCVILHKGARCGTRLSADPINDVMGLRGLFGKLRRGVSFLRGGVRRCRGSLRTSGTRCSGPFTCDGRLRRGLSERYRLGTRLSLRGTGTISTSLDKPRRRERTSSEVRSTTVMTRSGNTCRTSERNEAQ